MAQLFFLSGQTLVDGNGTPYAAAKASFFETGTTTPKNTYSNASLVSANANPVVADADGRFPDIYLIAGRYKVTLTTSADVAIDTLDPVDGTSQLITASSAPGTTYPFLRYYNTTDGRVYRRNAANSGWIDEGLVDELINAATVSEVLTGTSTAKAVTPDALAGLWQRGADIASASTISLPAGGGGVYNITGTTGITGISSAQGGRCIKVRFAGALTITHNGTSLILPGAANITTVAGDVAEFINEAAQDASGSNWRCFNYQRASGSSVNITDQIATQADQETATSVLLSVTPGRQQFHPSAAKAWGMSTLSAGVPASPPTVHYNITSVTDTGTGRAVFVIATDFSSADWNCVAMPEQNIPTVNQFCGIRQTTRAAGSIEIDCMEATSGIQDPFAYNMAAFGDQ